MCCHHSCRITVFGAVAHVGIRKHSLVHSFLQSEVEYCLFVAIVNTCHLSQIALFFIRFYLVNYRGWQILQRCLGVAGHKFLTIHQNLLHFLSVDGNLAVVVNLRSWQSLHQLFHHRTFWCAIGGTIIYKGVFLHRHLHGLCRHLCFLQQYGVRSHCQCAERKVLILGYRNVFICGMIAYARYFQQIAAVLWSREAECSLLVAHSSSHIRTVGSEQLHRGLHHWLLGVFIYYGTCYLSALCRCRECGNR